MKRHRFLIAALAWAAAFATTLPSTALPSPLGYSGPSVGLEIQKTGVPLEVEITVNAGDPDGAISSMEVCLANECTSEAFPAPDAVQQLQRCIEGDFRTMTVRRRAPDFGIFTITAKATAGGCPVIGADQTAVAEKIVAFPPPAAPIPCADTGSPTPTETGVTDGVIHLGATAAMSGPITGSTAAAARGIVAAIGRINDAGGVCGRTLQLTAYDDGFDAQQGRIKIQQLISDGVFALVGMPSWPGLQAAIEAGDIDAAGIPVVGTTGETAAELNHPLVWPVGAGRNSFAYAAVKQAYDNGARTFAVVWDDLVGSGVLAAMRTTIAGLAGATLAAERRVSISEPNYDSVINDVRRQCGDQMCDAVVLAIDTMGAVKFSHASEQQGIRAPATALTPAAFNRLFERNCGDCRDFYGWTAFHPPIGDAPPAVAEYHAVLQSLDPTADATNPYTEAAYAGTMVAAIAMGRAGTNLTRAGLKAVLDSQSFDIGLTAAPLSWNGTRQANRSLRSYQSVTVDGNFSGWRSTGDWITQP